MQTWVFEQHEPMYLPSSVTRAELGVLLNACLVLCTTVALSKFTKSSRSIDSDVSIADVATLDVAAAVALLTKLAITELAIYKIKVTIQTIC